MSDIVEFTIAVPKAAAATVGAMLDRQLAQLGLHSTERFVDDKGRLRSREAKKQNMRKRRGLAHRSKRRRP